MIANISPCILSIEETLNTLKYANRAKNLKIKLKKNVIETDYHISKYDEVIAALRYEIDQLKEQLVKKNDLSASFIIDDAGITQSNTNQELTDRIEKIQRDITSHFQDEIKLRKEIVAVERKSGENKIEIADQEYQLYKITSSNSKESDHFKNRINNLYQENEINQKNLNENYSKQSELMKKRSILQKTITQITKENPAGGKILMHTYMYYSTILDNMILEHRRHINMTEVRRKDFQIDKLVDQIKVRDKFIVNATTEIKKKKIFFKSNNENCKSLEEIEMEPLRLPVMVHNLNENTNSVDTNRKNMSTRTLLKSNNKSPTPQHRSYDYELSLLNKSKDYHLNTLNKKQKDKTREKSIIKDNAVNLTLNDQNEKIYYVNNTGNKSNIHNRRINIDQKKLALLLNNQNNDNLERSFDYGVNKLNQSGLSNRSASNLEKEMQQKVKTILKKDIIGRYRRSPYLKNFEKL